MTDEIKSALQAKFPAHEVKCRLGATTADKTKGMPLFYIDARAVQRRLDEVFGWDGWQVAYREIGSKGVLCRLSVKIGDAWIGKEDGADLTDIEPTKGGISDALRRVAASGFGIGRYLYDVKADWVPIVPYGNSHRFASKPQLPPSALPASATPQARPAPQPEPEPEQDVFDEAAKVVGETQQPTPQPTQPEPAANDDVIPLCPECGGEMYDKREYGGAIAFACKKRKWDRASKKDVGECSGKIWMKDWLKQQSAKNAPVTETLDYPQDDIPF